MQCYFHAYHPQSPLLVSACASHVYPNTGLCGDSECSGAGTGWFPCVTPLSAFQVTLSTQNTTNFPCLFACFPDQLSEAPF